MGGLVPARAIRDGSIRATQRNAAFYDYGYQAFDARPVFLNSTGTAAATTVNADVNLMCFGNGDIWEYRNHTGTPATPIWDATNGRGLSLFSGAGGIEMLPFTALTAASARGKYVRLIPPNFDSTAPLNTQTTTTSPASTGCFLRVKFYATSGGGAAGTLLIVGIRSVEAYSATATYQQKASMALNAADLGLFSATTSGTASSSATFAMTYTNTFEYRCDVTPVGKAYQSLFLIQSGSPASIVANSTSNPSGSPLAASYLTPFIFTNPTTLGTASIVLQEVEFGPRIPKRRG